MEKIKLSNISNIIFDLDGTLLNDKKELFNENIELLNKLCEFNLNIIIATARPYRAVKIYFNEKLLKNISLILYNGDQIYIAGRCIKKYDISEEDIKYLYKDLYKKFRNLIFGFEFNDQCFVNNNFSRHWDAIWEKKINFNENIFKPSPKVMIDLNIDGLKDYILKNYSNRFSIKITDKNSLCQIMPKNISKYFAFEYILKNKKMQNHKTICFGDDSNDIELFKYCGYPVALENSIDDLKKLSCFITKSNNENGVSYFFNEYIDYNK